MVSNNNNFILKDFWSFFNGTLFLACILLAVVNIHLEHELQKLYALTFVLDDDCFALDEDILEQERRFWHTRSHEHILLCAAEQGLNTVINQGLL
jgi:hypothetical protein